MLPNVIIGGTQKAGTTSLFRYLAAHPSVCHSSTKEIDFFLKHPGEIEDEIIKKYASFFSRCSSNQPIRLEASPQYLMLSGSVAKQIFSVLPNIKLIFILREPIDVLLSYIKFKPGISTQTLSLESFVAMAEENKIPHHESGDETGKSHILSRLQAGCYVMNLQKFLAYYSKDQIGVFFYDELSQDTSSFMAKVCNFLQIDGNFYNDFQFKVENKTRTYKYPQLHRYAAILNLKWESFFNRYPSIRNAIRSIYHLISEAPEEKIAVTESDLQKLKKYYAPFNRQLCSLLHQTYPDLARPTWFDTCKLG